MKSLLLLITLCIAMPTQAMKVHPKENDKELRMMLALLSTPFTRVNQKSGDDGRTPLLCAVQVENIQLTEYLIEKGARINAADIDGLTPLHMAITKNNLALVEILVRNGADVNQVDLHSITPLRHAYNTNSRNEIKEYLEAHGAKRDLCPPRKSCCSGCCTVQ